MKIRRNSTEANELDFRLGVFFFVPSYFNFFAHILKDEESCGIKFHEKKVNSSEATFRKRGQRNLIEFLVFVFSSSRLLLHLDRSVPLFCGLDLGIWNLNQSFQTLDTRPTTAR